MSSRRLMGIRKVAQISRKRDSPSPIPGPSRLPPEYDTADFLKSQVGMAGLAVRSARRFPRSRKQTVLGQRRTAILGCDTLHLPHHAPTQSRRLVPRRRRRQRLVATSTQTMDGAKAEYRVAAPTLSSTLLVSLRFYETRIPVL